MKPLSCKCHDNATFVKGRTSIQILRDIIVIIIDRPRWLHDIQLQLEAKDETNRGPGSVQYRGRLFTLLPIFSHETKHVMIDTRILEGFGNILQVDGQHDVEFEKDESGDGKAEIFNYNSNKTDGNSVSILLHQNKKYLINCLLMK